MKTRTQKQSEAIERQQAYEKLTTKQKYNRAVKRGHRNSREAIRLLNQMEAEKK